MLKYVNNIHWWAKAKINTFLHEEKGAVEIVAIVILIGIAVVLAIIFKDAIVELLSSLLSSIKGNADNAVAPQTAIPNP